VAAQADRPLAVALYWIEAHCVIPDRDQVGEPFRLFDAQLRFLTAHYTVRGSATPGELGPAFLFRRSQLVAPQKAGKSPLEAAQTCLEAVGPALLAGWAEGGEVYDCRTFGCGCGFLYEYEPGEPMGKPWPTPLVQITASSIEQTENIYDALRPMIELGPLAEVIPKTGEEFIRLPNGGRIDVVTSSAKSRLGQRVTFIPQDETGTWTKQTGMVKVAEIQRRGLAGMGGRSVEITNAWDPSEESVAQRTAESRRPDIYRQHVVPPANLSYRDKRQRHKIHTIVYAGWWGERNLASIEAEAAELLERDPAQAERFYGNRIVHGQGTWLVDGLWEKRTALQDVPDGTAICLGFDGSESDDWTALRAETIDGYRFTPTYGPDSRPTIWNPAEWNGSIPRGEVHAAVDEVCRRFRVKRAYCDPRDWQSEIGDWSLRHGDDVFVEWATYRVVPMHAALEREVTDLTSGRTTHDGCPITAAHVANARKLAKPGDRYILGKPNQHQKIDAAMADALVHEAAADARAEGWTDEPTHSYGFASA
jgi:hypothetical protein